MAKRTRIKWFCHNYVCDYSTDDLDKFIEHLKDEHEIYISYEIEEGEPRGGERINYDHQG